MQNSTDTWWRNAVIYQIYPKSFCDSGAKGTGDINGIRQKLDYLKQLEVDGIWLTPIYCSPQIDNGYDISDYYRIDPAFGTLEEFRQLLDEAHERGIRVIMDIVINHTSTEHAWFKAAVNDPAGPYRDYYIWKDPVNGDVPNNWQSKFGGSAWEFEPNSGQYYLHLFAREQADLNWENPAVREEVKKVIRFWADMGVDGFRLDVINLISKDQRFPDDDGSIAPGDGRRFYTDGPRVHEFLQELNREVFSPLGVMTVGEMSSTTLEHCQRYSAQDQRELSMVFNFHHLKVDYPDGEKWSVAPFDLLQLKQIFAKWQQGLHDKGWNALFWCNHDQPRIVSRFGDEGQFHQVSAKMLATAVHMLQGTPFIYQGEEIGMTNAGYQRIDDYVDVESRNMYDLLLGQGRDSDELLEILRHKSRDNARTPMQWNASEHAGFSQGAPWLKVAHNYRRINVEQALADQDSVFYHYRELIRLRKRYPVITHGDYQELLPEDPRLYCYLRRYQDQVMLVMNNFYGEAADCELPEWDGRGILLLSNYADSASAPQARMTLRPYESLVYLIEEAE